MAGRCGVVIGAMSEPTLLQPPPLFSLGIGRSQHRQDVRADGAYKGGIGAAGANGRAKIVPTPSQAYTDSEYGPGITFIPFFSSHVEFLDSVAANEEAHRAKEEAMRADEDDNISISNKTQDISGSTKDPLNDDSNEGGHTSLELLSPGGDGDGINPMEFGSFDTDMASDNEDLLLGDVFADLLGEDGEDPFTQDMLGGELLAAAPVPSSAMKPASNSSSSLIKSTASRRGVNFPTVFRRTPGLPISSDLEADAATRKQEPPKVFNKSKRQIELLKAEGYRMFATEDWFKGKDMSWLFVNSGDGVSSPQGSKPQFFKGKMDDSYKLSPEGQLLETDGMSPKPKKAGGKSKALGSQEEDLMKEDVDASLDLLGLIKPKKLSKKNMSKLTPSASGTSLDEIESKDGFKASESNGDLFATNMPSNGASGVGTAPATTKGKAANDASKLLSTTIKPKIPFRVIPVKPRGTKNLQLYLQTYMKSLNGRSNSIERLKTENGIPPSKHMPAANTVQKQRDGDQDESNGVTLRKIISGGSHFGTQFLATVGSQNGSKRDVSVANVESKVVTSSPFDPKGLISDPVSMYLLYASTQSEVANAVVQASSLFNPRSSRAADIVSRKRAVLTSFDEMCKKAKGDAKKAQSKSPAADFKSPLDIAISQKEATTSDDSGNATETTGNDSSSSDTAIKQQEVPFLKNVNVPGLHSVELSLAMYSGYNLVSCLGEVFPDLASTRDIYNPTHPQMFSAAEARRNQINMAKIFSLDVGHYLNKSTCLFEGFDNTRLGTGVYRIGGPAAPEPQKPIVNNATKRAKAAPKAQQQVAPGAVLTGAPGQMMRPGADGSLHKPMLEGSRLLTAIASANAAANMAKRTISQVSSMDGSSNMGPDSKIQRLSPGLDSQMRMAQAGAPGSSLPQQQMPSTYSAAASNINLAAIAAATAQQRAGMAGMTAEAAALARARALQAAQASRMLQMQAAQAGASASNAGMPGAVSSNGQQGSGLGATSMVLPSLPPASGTSAPWMQSPSTMNFAPANAASLIPSAPNTATSGTGTGTNVVGAGAVNLTSAQLTAAYVAQLQAAQAQAQRANMATAGVDKQQALRMLPMGNAGAATATRPPAAPVTVPRIASMKDVLTAPYLSTLSDKSTAAAAAASASAAMGQMKTMPLNSQQQSQLQQMQMQQMQLQMQMQMQYAASQQQLQQQHNMASVTNNNSSNTISTYSGPVPSSSFPQMPGLSAAVAAAPNMLVATQLPLSNLPSGSNSATSTSNTNPCSNIHANALSNGLMGQSSTANSNVRRTT